MVGFAGSTTGGGLASAGLDFPRGTPSRAVRLGQEVHDERLRNLLRFRREPAEPEKEEDEAEVDAKRQREAGEAALERRALVRRGEPVGGQRRFVGSASRWGDLTTSQVEPRVKLMGLDLTRSQKVNLEE